MPGPNAQRGDLYCPKPDVIVGGDAHAGPRRVVCVAERPQDDFAWTAMSRTTTAYDPTVDLFSAAAPNLGLTKDGWWSHRYIRSVKKRWTGHPTECPFLGTLVDPVKSQVLNHYKGRPRPVVGT